MTENIIKTTEDILLILCNSVKKVLSIATQTDIQFSPMIQRIQKTSLHPDIGCFVLFDGGVSGLVIMNFTELAAIEVYRSYMINMGMPEEELTRLYTSDEVADTLGELMNQIMGDFQVELKKEFRISINQNQPKMIVINKELMVSFINTKIEDDKCLKVAFETADYRPFYLELSIENTEFVQLFPFEKEEAIDPDQIVAQAQADQKKATPDGSKGKDSNIADPDFMKKLGL